MRMIFIITSLCSHRLLRWTLIAWRVPDRATCSALHMLHSWTCIKSIWQGQFRNGQFIQTFQTFDLPLSSQVKLLGIIQDNRLTLDSHIKAMNKSVSSDISSFHHIWHTLKENTTKTVVCTCFVLDLIMPMRFFTTPRHRISQSCNVYRTLLPGLFHGLIIMC